MELRRQIIIQELNRAGVFETEDGRMISRLTLQELELTRSRHENAQLLAEAGR
ncbi:Fur-regulated basic protein FbpA [Alteribacter lacisalsi]|uniref:Fur-regulated basic protein FbpA n=1 Tax=Alteribacter lacisalsi TaxID=2045244 RepID=UPI00115AD8B7|nr:Fur-regulated basic protein FbpA [Alteribacter lacisalsi]